MGRITLPKRLDGAFDRVAHTKLTLLFGSPSSFRLWLTVATLVGGTFAIALATRIGFVPAVVLSLLFPAIVTPLVLNLGAKLLTGEERMTNYHQQLAALLGAAAVLALLRQPLLPYLDLTVLGIGVFIACGRVGCLMVGCCHGRPHPWGIYYGEEHVREGFPAYLAGVRLFPIQAVESLWVLGMVVVGTVLLFSQPPGTVLAWHIVTYGVGRFFIEFQRGDAVRPYWRGFSEAQWTALGTVWGVVVAAALGWLPFPGWALGAALGLTATMLLVTVHRQRHVLPRYRLLHPRHIREVAQVLDTLAAAAPATLSNPKAIPIATTSLGLRFSAGRFVDEQGAAMHHYSISSVSAPLTVDALTPLAALIVQLRYPACTSKLVPGQQPGFYHLLIEGAA